MKGENGGAIRDSGASEAIDKKLRRHGGWIQLRVQMAPGSTGEASIAFPVSQLL